MRMILSTIFWISGIIMGAGSALWIGFTIVFVSSTEKPIDFYVDWTILTFITITSFITFIGLDKYSLKNKI